MTETEKKLLEESEKLRNEVIELRAENSRLKDYLKVANEQALAQGRGQD